MVLFYLVLIVVWLIVQGIVARKFEEIAFQKGYCESVHSFAMCFWLGIIGYLYVIALPPIEKRERQEKPVNNPVADDTARKQLPDERYRCTYFVAKFDEHKGRCVVCRTHSESLRTCKVKTDIGTREIPVCERCRERFIENLAK